MEKETKNLCAQIPIELHRQVREQQETSGKSLGEYMTWLITTFYETEERKTMNTDTRTVAFQVPDELFEEFKEYLQRHNLKQKAFFLGCIQQALADDADTRTDQEPPEGQETASELQEESES